MNKNRRKNETIIRYLLGDLPEPERAALEDSFLGDAELFEQIADAENDLVDDFVAGRLSEKQRGQFENYYLAVPENREKVAVARILHENRQLSTPVSVVAAQANFWQSIRAFFVSWQFTPVAAAVLLLAIGGLWLALRSNPNDEIALQQPTPAPTIATVESPPAVAPPANVNAAQNLNLNSNQTVPRPSPTLPRGNTGAIPKPLPPRVERETAKPLTPAENRGVTLALVAGLVREGGEANKLVVPKNARQVRLTFDLPVRKYSDIEARIETVAGKPIWNGKIWQSGTRAALNLPARLFADEDYLLIVSGTNAAGEREDFQNLYFNSERR